MQLAKNIGFSRHNEDKEEQKKYYMYIKRNIKEIEAAHKMIKGEF